MATLQVRPAAPSTLFAQPSASASLAGPDSAMAVSFARPLSRFESILTTHPTVVESLLAQLPTRSLIDLYHASRHLRHFLASYPLAWRTLSFRAPQPALGVNNPDGDAADGTARASKQWALDALLIQVVVPFGTRLTSLDLCNTAVSGVRLISRVLEPRVRTLQHLSVRGCKNVSIKYHLVPFLEPYVHPGSPWASTNELALKSLYTYRCRHHRRRPYLPSSLMRRDSDSEPTHQLIEICHQLGIWTDTMWCTTPGSRCFRRKDYYSGRATPGTNEVWVPFDRLWRSGNRIGPADSGNPPTYSDGRLWEDAESGHDGEPLGPSGDPSADGRFKGEGKDVPAHLRKSHRIFVEEVKCDQCADPILERCEQCSIRMHCMGCRKTLCASCAFNRPIPRKRRKTNRAFTNLAFGHSNNLGITPTNSNNTASNSEELQAEDEERNKKNHRFWWAPGATRSPNLMSEVASDDDASDDDDVPIGGGGNPLTVMNVSTPPKLDMHWCCVEPVFSGGGGIVVLGPSVGGKGADKIRATPLPKGQQYEDPDFTSVLRSPEMIRELKNATLYEHVLGEHVDVLPYLQQDSLELQASTCPRSLCQDCYRTFRWKVSCKTCKKPLCKEHDFRALKIRKCGYRDLHVEREYLRTHTPPAMPSPSPIQQIPAFVPPDQRPPQSSPMAAQCSAESHASSAAADNQNLTQWMFMTNLHQEEGTMTKSIPSLDHPQPLTAKRPRALSASDGSSSRANSPSRSQHYSVARKIAERERARKALPLPGTLRHPVQWRGCGAYFCQQLRPVGDCRQRCSAGMRECGDCGVLVCDGCLNANPPCPCAYCSTHYHCPVCSSKPRVQTLCRRDAERQAARLKELAEAERRAKELEALVRADEMAAAVGEFFRDFIDAQDDSAGLDETPDTCFSRVNENNGDEVHHIEVAEAAPEPGPSSQGHDQQQDRKKADRVSLESLERILLTEPQLALLAELDPIARSRMREHMFYANRRDFPHLTRLFAQVKDLIVGETQPQAESSEMGAAAGDGQRVASIEETRAVVEQFLAAQDKEHGALTLRMTCVAAAEVAASSGQDQESDHTSNAETQAEGSGASINETQGHADVNADADAAADNTGDEGSSHNDNDENTDGEQGVDDEPSSPSEASSPMTGASAEVSVEA